MLSGRTHVAASRAARSVVCVLIWAALAAGSHAAAPDFASGPAETAVSPSTPTLTATPPASLVEFKLGNAGRPFGWASGVADFNTDGRADVASIDRVARQPGLSSYRLEFSVSGLRVDDIAFESNEESLALSVSDIDRDNDLDVVVSGMPSGHTVGVWLNDGHGRFTQADPPQFPIARSASSFDALAPTADPSPGLVQTSHYAAPLLAGRITPDAFSRGSFVRGYGSSRPLARAFLSQAGPRAPPVL